MAGPIPTELGCLTEMQQRFDLSSNKWGASMPSEIGKLTLLAQEFYFEDSSVTSTIPSELGNLRMMTEYLGLGSNLLSSSIPTEFGALGNMVNSFSMEWNRLSSSLPTELGKLSQLTSYLLVDANQLSSSVPTELGKLTQMYFSFSLEANSLSGAMPTELGHLSLMTQGFILSSNLLCGAMPTQVAALSLSMTNWFVTTGNSFGTTCDPSDDDGAAAGNVNRTVSIAITAVVVLAVVVVLAIMLSGCSHLRSSAFGVGDAASGRAPLLEHGAYELSHTGAKSRRLGSSASSVESDRALYNSWGNSNAQIMVLDQDLCIVLWSRGMTKATSGIEPLLGASVESLPFPSARTRARMVNSLREVVSDTASDEAALLPGHALQAAVIAIPNVMMQLATPALGVGSQQDILLSMAAKKMRPLSSIGPVGLGATCHLLVMVHEQVDPSLASLWGEGDALSDLSSDTGSSPSEPSSTSWLWARSRPMAPKGTSETGSDTTPSARAALTATGSEASSDGSVQTGGTATMLRVFGDVLSRLSASEKHGASTSHWAAGGRDRSESDSSRGGQELDLFTSSMLGASSSARHDQRSQSPTRSDWETF
mmetsp:Transcript_8974/g.22436  ORF Transcript_8974/g.22436 Transcript_8974/m.22436 type:complete len:595 (+) Transcript_8974:889-2673(+)